MTTPILIHQQNLQFDQPPGPPNSLNSNAFNHSNSTSNSTSTSCTNTLHSPLITSLTPSQTDDLNLETLSLCSSTSCSSYEAVCCVTAQESKEKFGGTEKVTEKSFVVAISGPSSVGKSTLAILLGEIFKGENATGLLIHQDSYFHSKPDCPSVSFLSTSTPSETAFIRSTLALIHSPSSPPLYAISSSASSPNQYLITGPNTDVDGAINFPLLHSDLVSLITYPSSSNYKIRMTPALATSFEAYHANILFLVQEHAELIEEMRKRVTSFVRAQASQNIEARFGGKLIRGPIEKHVPDTISSPELARLQARLIFVEGFLLFSPPPSSPSPSPSAPSNQSSDSQERRTQTAISNQEKKNLEAKHKLQALFNVKLFLSASKASLKARRFSRWEYVDEAAGGGRKAGQLWKSEGYFERVAWRDYSGITESLVHGEGKKKKVDGANEGKGEKGNMGAEVRIRIEKHASGGVEDAVGWAVDVILEEMRQVEEEARKELEAVHE